MNSQRIIHLSEEIAPSLQAIASPARIAILLTIGTGEACVCHLEAALGWRQAYISQHLMALRKGEILRDRRDGRFVYYRLANPTILDLVLAAAQLSGIAAENIRALVNSENNPSCECPQCVEQQPDSGRTKVSSHLFESEGGLP